MTADRDAPSVPERIGPYDLLIPIGTGGMGSVYLGRREVMAGVTREVAVKLMHPRFRDEEDVVEQLMHEARLAASVRHPNVVSVLEAGDSPHGVYLAMDYVEGDTLATLLRAIRKRGELPPLPVVARIVRDALTGLHAAHELEDAEGRPLKLVHRDFSPQNILVGVDGSSRLTDFGIAKALGSGNATATGIIKGKVGYMAPEHARGERVDRRSDVWSAGVVTWEAITGKRLFKAANDAATLLMVVSDKRPPEVSRAREGLSALLDAAVAAALEPKPSRRIATALAFRDRLDEAFGEHGGIADQEEVAAYLRELVGDRIEGRRQRAREVLALREQIATVSADAVALANSDDTSSGGTPADPREFEEVSTKAALSAATRGAGRRRRWLWPAVSLVALLGALGALASWSRSAAPLDARSADVAATEQVAPSSAAAGDASSEPPPAARVLRVRADEPIAQLTIDERTIVLPDPSPSVEVPLAEGAALAHLLAIASDGRRAELELSPDSLAVRIEFPAATPSSQPAPAPRRPPRRAPPAKPVDDGPGLADSPY